jgi:hypothetical protein
MYFEVNAMIKTLWATVRQGKIEPIDSTELPEGSRVLVTLLPDDEAEFWLQASQRSLNEVWDNIEDDVYTPLTSLIGSVPVSFSTPGEANQFIRQVHDTWNY